MVVSEDIIQPKIKAPHLIDSRQAARDLQTNLQGVKQLAIDTESNSLHAYQEQVCLIQITVNGEDFLLDPLMVDAQDSLGFLGDICANPNIEKILHAAEYDIMCLNRDFGFAFNNLFDTMTAGRILGHEHIGLGSMLETHFGLKLDKKHQRANWGERPLSPAMIRYAQLDTHYLVDLRNILYKELERQDRLEESREIFDEVCASRWHQNEFDPDNFWNIKGARDLAPRGQAILKELYIYREHQAIQRDRPVFKILGNHILLEIATKRPRSLKHLSRIRGMSQGQIRRYGKGLLQALEQGLSEPIPSQPNNHHQRDEQIARRYDALHTWRKNRAAARGVSSDIIMPKSALSELANTVPQTWGELEDIQHIGAWRRKTYGSELLTLLSEIG